MNNAISTKSMLGPVLILTVVGSAFLLAGWCVFDYFLVRSPRYPAGIHDYDWLLPWSPLFVFALDYLISIWLQVRRRWVVSALATLCAIPLGVGLILQFGVLFHFWLGGRL